MSRGRCTPPWSRSEQSQPTGLRASKREVLARRPRVPRREYRPPDAVAQSTVEVGATTSRTGRRGAKRGRRAICPDLVGGVTVRGDPVGAGEHRVDLSSRHQRRGGGAAITVSGIPAASSSHAVRRATLEEGTGSPTQTCSSSPRFQGGAQRPEGGPVATRSEPARVAVRERARAGGAELRGVRGHRRQRATSSGGIRTPVRPAVRPHPSSAQPRSTSVGRDPRRTRSAATRSSPAHRPPRRARYPRRSRSRALRGRPAFGSPRRPRRGRHSDLYFLVRSRR